MALRLAFSSPVTGWLKAATCALLLSTLTCGMATAAPLTGHHAHQAQSGGLAVSESQAAAIASRRSGGKVLKVQRKGGGYNVKVLEPSGKVTIIWVDGGAKKGR